MNPNVRSAILIAGLLFVILFAGMTLVVLAEDGLTILVFFSLLIVGAAGRRDLGRDQRPGRPALAGQSAEQPLENALEGGRAVRV